MQQMPEPIQSRLLAQEALCLFYIISSILMYQLRKAYIAQITSKTFVYTAIITNGTTSLQQRTPLSLHRIWL
jgi:hypothetical protein